MPGFLTESRQARPFDGPATKPGRPSIPSLLPGLAVLVASVFASTGVHAATTIYKYDELGRVVEAEYETAKVTYAYDAADNRSSKQSVALVPTPLTSSMTSVLMHATTGAVLTVNVGGASPGGTVSFYDGTTFLGSAAVVGGVATIEVLDLSLGVHTITATYSGHGANPRSSLTLYVKVVNLDWLPAVLDLLLL